MKEQSNKASISVWNEYFKSDENREITKRIEELNSYHELNKEEKDELTILLKKEKENLQKSENISVINLKTLKKLDFYKEKLKDDERLVTIYFEKINEELSKGVLLTEEKVSDVYHEIMTLDMEVDGHESLNKYYDNYINHLMNEDVYDNEFDTNDCVYCTPPSDKEYQSAYESLLEQGYFEDKETEEEKLVELMILVHRLEDKLDMLNFEINFDFSEEDIDDEEDE